MVASAWLATAKVGVRDSVLAILVNYPSHVEMQVILRTGRSGWAANSMDMQAASGMSLALLWGSLKYQQANQFVAPE